MQDTTKALLAVGAFLLGALAIERLIQPSTPCQGSANSQYSQTCLGPICWSSCTQTGPAQDQGNNAGTGGNQTVANGDTSSQAYCMTVSPFLWWLNPQCWKYGTLGW